MGGGNGSAGSAGASTGGSAGATTAGVAGVGGGPAAGAGGSGLGGSGGAVSPAGLDTGRVVMRRLTRFEYDNTVRQLLGTELRPSETFASVDDISVEGYATIGLVQSFTNQHGEDFEKAAEALVDELFARPSSDAARSRVLSCEVGADNADACTREVLGGFMRRAFRRAVEAAEVEDFVQLAGAIRANGSTPEQGLKAALRATLLSPHFLYKVEIDPSPQSPEAHPVSPYELGTRLSYLLWSSSPDDALLDAAQAGVLGGDPAELGRQFDRLMSDPRSDALITTLANEWLTLRAIDEVAPASATFPGFDEALRTGMRQESATFFAALVAGNSPVEDLLLAEYTYANARMSEHYGLVESPGSFSRVSLAGTPRIGILTQASFLSFTSYPERTSPVKRGQWVLEQLLCTPPPAPPNDVNTALDPPTPTEGMTLREKMALHSSDSKCAGCHSSMDPIGFGLENFDAIGAYRTLDNGRPVDATGFMAPDDTPFNGAREMARLIASDGRFVPCLLEHFMTYGIGRSFRADDAKAYTFTLADQARAQGGTWRSILQTLVNSEAFQTQRGEAL